ncbi:hypothetical protein Ae201684P_008705 [Aphanomyces euteiches]|nr:hypothetical protein Ae201684P_008705 [Aphanomyces euteiches]
MPVHRSKAGSDDGRRVSLATQVDLMSCGSAFERLVLENGPNVQNCRDLLVRPVNERTVEQVHTMKLFFSTSKIGKYCSNLDLQKETEFYKALQLQTFDEARTYVFCQGDVGDKFYVIFSGTVEVRKQMTTPSGETVENSICILRPGDCFGERALVGALNEPHHREASIVTLTDMTELAFMDKASYSKIMRDRQGELVVDMPKSAGLEVTKRFRSNKDIVRTIFLQLGSDRTERDLKFAVEYLKGVKFFGRFSFEVRKQLCKALRLVCAWTNTTIFEEGQPGHHFYILFSGCVEVLVTTTNRYDTVIQTAVATLKEGETFGELALSEENGVRRATVVATEYTELLTLSRDEYIPLIQKYQNQFHMEYVHLLQHNPYFMGEEWDATTLEAMCSVMVEKYIPYQGEVFKQGSRATEMYIVVRGECIAKHEGKDPFTNEDITVVLGRYGPNSVLGCAEATAGKFNDVFIRSSSIYATSPVKVLVLSRFDIFHLLSPEARASLQKWSNDEQSESIHSRVLKTIVWEKYRAQYRQAGPDPMPALSPMKKLPAVKTIDIQHRQVVDSGELELYERPKLTYFSSLQDLRRSKLSVSRTDSLPSLKAKPSLDSFDNRQPSLSSSLSMPSLSAVENDTQAQPSSGLVHFNPLAKATPSTPDRGKTPAFSHHTRQFLWTPLHGVYQPFAVVGFGRIQGSTTAFRVCGKFRELDGALEMFHDICKLEPIVADAAIHDRGAFTIYKDGDVAMVLRNMHGDVPSTPEKEPPTALKDRLRSKRKSIVVPTEPSSIKKEFFAESHSIMQAVRRESNPEVIGQRFACIGVKQHASPDANELHVFVYHCFPTHQSAIRHSKRLVTMLNSFADNCLYVVPLFDWIYRDEIERYEGKSIDKSIFVKLTFT